MTFVRKEILFQGLHIYNTSFTNINRTLQNLQLFIIQQSPLPDPLLMSIVEFYFIMQFFQINYLLTKD